MAIFVFHKSRIFLREKRLAYGVYVGIPTVESEFHFLSVEQAVMNRCLFFFTGMLGLAVAEMLVSLEAIDKSDKSDSRSGKSQPENHCFLHMF